MLDKNQLKQEVHWIDSESQLVDICSAWQVGKLISVDTEFMRSRTYFPIAGLFQVNDGKANYLIDPTTITDFSAFTAVLEDASVIKVLHSCSEDLEVFHRVLGIVPSNLFDTQIAAAVMGYGFSVGFGNLCQLLFGIELPKSETRSNWLLRPLSDAQIQYAAIDVEYLTAIAVRLIKESQEANRLLWVKEECEKLISAFHASQDIEQAWQRNKNAWKLDSKQLHIFQQLSLWREERARERDVPRNRIIKDHTLIELAQTAPTELAELKKFEGVSERMLRSDGEVLLSLIEGASNADPACLPERLAKPLSSSAKDKIKTLRQKVQVVADTQKISPELLVRKKEYEDFVRSGLAANNWKLPESLSGWRRELVGDLLMNEIKQQ